MSTPHAPIRTPEKPMGFTGAEFCRGALAAWLLFMAILTVYLTVSAALQSGGAWGSPLSMIALYLMFGVPIGGIVSGVVTLVTAPLVHLFARRLAHTSRLSIHALAYAAIGALLGLVVGGVAALVAQSDLAVVFSTWFPWFVAAVCAVSIVGGWGWTVWRVTRPRRADPDALVEDAV
ncbi:hypothetical protein [Microbacterium sp.]|uniref:hypothetical protein n=1 Tax=Microbacterium sp. TaxID=51671 RepID=UPI002619AA7F|nr:hypothetical protein [Microbacterium sp.]